MASVAEDMAARLPGRVRTVGRAEHTRRGAVPVVAEQLGQVLVQRAAERDVISCGAAAHAEHRQARVECGLEELPLMAVPRLAGCRPWPDAGRAP